MLMNHRSLRVCVDGCYRVVRENYSVFTVGLLSKNVDWKTNRKDCFSTTFNEVLVAIVNSEKKECCLRVFEAWEKTMRVVLNVEDGRTRVDQFHSDHHKGIRSAAKAFFADAKMVLDFSHFTGASRRSKISKLQDAGSSEAIQSN